MLSPHRHLPPKPPTTRELAAVAAYCTEGRYKEAGRRLGISEQTAKSHVWNVCRKLGLRDGGPLAVARALGWLRIPPEPAIEAQGLAMELRQTAEQLLEQAKRLEGAE